MSVFNHSCECIMCTYASCYLFIFIYFVLASLSKPITQIYAYLKLACLCSVLLRILFNVMMFVMSYACQMAECNKLNQKNIISYMKVFISQ